MQETPWVLRHLGASGLTQPELTTVYKVVIRPILDYCCVGSAGSDCRKLSQALKSIYGYQMSYSNIRKEAGVTTLCACCIELCDAFARKAAANPRFKHWLPLKQDRRSAWNRDGEVYQEMASRADRLMNSPLFYYRRHFNGKVGKVYGERNRKFRDT